jgi:hypothetical protein
VNFETQELHKLEFMWGPADGRRYPVAKVRESYLHQDAEGAWHRYETEPRPRGGVWPTVYAGVREGVR